MTNPTPQPDPKALASELQRQGDSIEATIVQVLDTFHDGKREVKARAITGAILPLLTSTQEDAENWKSRAAERDAECERRFRAQHDAEALTLSQAKEIEGLKAALERVSWWINRLPIPTEGATHELSLIRAALSSSPDLVGGDQGSSVAGVQAAPVGATEEPKSNGQRIIDGLSDALAGNFTSQQRPTNPAWWAGFSCSECGFQHPHDHFVTLNHYGEEVAVINYHSEDPNAEVRDPDTGEVIFPARKAPFRLIEGSVSAENNLGSPTEGRASPPATDEPLNPLPDPPPLSDGGEG